MGRRSTYSWWSGESIFLFLFLSPQTRCSRIKNQKSMMMTRNHTRIVRNRTKSVTQTELESLAFVLPFSHLSTSNPSFLSVSLTRTISISRSSTCKGSCLEVESPGQVWQTFHQAWRGSRNVIRYAKHKPLDFPLLLFAQDYQTFDFFSSSSSMTASLIARGGRIILMVEAQHSSSLFSSLY